MNWFIIASFLISAVAVSAQADTFTLENIRNRQSLKNCAQGECAKRQCRSAKEAVLTQARDQCERLGGSVTQVSPLTFYPVLVTNVSPYFFACTVESREALRCDVDL